MKKSLSVLLVATIVLAMSTSCEKGLKESQCAAFVQDVTVAAQLYNANPTVMNCGIYKTAIKNYLDSPCSDNLSGPDRSALENKLNNLPC